jgi:hypothetical protein
MEQRSYSAFVAFGSKIVIKARRKAHEDRDHMVYVIDAADRAAFVKIDMSEC